MTLTSAYGEIRYVGEPRHLRAYGVPPGGPFDRLAAALANALADLPEATPTLEITLGPVVLEATEPVTVAVVGGPDGAFPLVQGERMEVRPIGARAYVATAPNGPGRTLAHPPRPETAPLRVVAGSQADRFDFAKFAAGSYTVGLASNRVGIRLEGTGLPHTISLPSEPAVPGVIQVPPSGQPIILGPDGPTIGGYPKIAVVIDADRDRLGRLRPGDRLTFRAVDLDEAHREASNARQERQRRCAELRIRI